MKEDVPECDAEMACLRANGLWDIARPVKTAKDLIQPFLMCESWDWHSATTAKALMHWAGLLSIVGLPEDVNVNTLPDDNEEPQSWQNHGSDYLCFMPMAQTLEGLPRGHPMNVNMHYLRGDAAWMTVENIQKEKGKLDEMFDNLFEARKNTHETDDWGHLHDTQWHASRLRQGEEFMGCEQSRV